MPNQTPFLDVRSFTEEEVFGHAEEAPGRGQPASPFLAVYELDEEGGVDPQAEEYVAFLNELYDEQLNEALSSLVDEAAALHETHGRRERNGQGERLLTQHFAPLVTEAETLIRAVAAELGQRAPETLAEAEIDSIVDRHRPSAPINPQFEEWLGRALKKVVSKGVDLAKKAATAVAKVGLIPTLNRLLGLLRPMVKRVVESAIDRLPANLQPIARTLRDKVPFLKEVETEAADPADVAEIQHEFNQAVANLLFAQSETEQDLEVARAVSPPAGPHVYPLAELETARERFIEGLGGLREGEDPTPQVEQFVPALLPVLKIGLKLAGRQRAVDFLANFLGKLIQKFVGPQHAPPLSRAIVDAGLRLLHLEAAEENEARAAASAVASTVEETVRRVAALPEYVLDDQELLEGAALEAFEQAAANNLPPVLSADTYRKRPELRERRGGFWYRRGRRYKKRVGPRILARVSPHRLAALETFDGATVGEALEEQYAIAPGDELEAEVHLYEAMPGMRLSDIVRGEEVVAKGEGDDGRTQLHPLTREAAALLLDEPEIGREAGDPTAPQPGQRFFYLELAGKRPLMVPVTGGRPHLRHRSRCRIVLHFPRNEIVARVYLSEVRAQALAVRLRQHAHLGTAADRLRRFIQRGVNRAFADTLGQLKIVHGAVVPGRPMDALGRLPALVPKALGARVTEWLVKGLTEHLQKHAGEFIQASGNTADGVTIEITLENPPGFRQLGEALKGKGIALGSLTLPEGHPAVRLAVSPGFKGE